MDGAYRLIVIGSGIAGLFVALEAHRAGLRPILVLTKGSVDDCNTRWAQGGIAAAVGPHDSVEQHFRDTVAAGAGLVDEEAAWILCSEAPARIRDLIDYGVSFDSLGGEVVLGREAAGGPNRLLGWWASISAAEPRAPGLLRWAFRRRAAPAGRELCWQRKGRPHPGPNGRGSLRDTCPPGGRCS